MKNRYVITFVKTWGVQKQMISCPDRELKTRKKKNKSRDEQTREVEHRASRNNHFVESFSRQQSKDASDIGYEQMQTRCSTPKQSNKAVPRQRASFEINQPSTDARYR